MDDDIPKKTRFGLGDDLYGLSIGELEDRISMLTIEISRVERELSKKRDELSAADQLFTKINWLA